MMKVYLDTNIIMDFLEGRNKKAFEIIQASLDCKFYLIISDLVLKELDYQNMKYEMFLKLISRKLIQVITEKEDTRKAKKYLGYTHPNDALHAVLAEKAKADKLLTQNIKDFTFLKIAINYDGF